MEELVRIQEEINALYFDKFRKYEGGLNLSVPLVPRISSSYLKNRIVVVGQETNTWYREGIDDLHEIFLKRGNVQETAVNSRYDHFIRNTAQKYGGKFWAFQRMLYEEGIVDGEMVKDGVLSHCWINLFSVEACRNKKDENGRPTKNSRLAAEIIKIQEKLLHEMLFILQPKLIVFLTGPSLDFYLKTTGINDLNCKWMKLDVSNVLSVDQLAEVEITDTFHPLFNTKIIRCYHPSYFMARINSHKNLAKKLENCGVTNVAYYTRKVIETLRNYKSKECL